MPTNYTPLLGLALPTTGELSGTWGDVENASITNLVDTAVAGTTSLATDGDITLTATTGVANQARSAVLLCTGTRTAIRNITAPASSKVYVVVNATSGGFAVVLRGTGPTTGVSIPAGYSGVVAWTGSDFALVGTTLWVNAALTGTPTAPTAAAGTNNTQIASTAFAMNMTSPAFAGTPTAPTAATPTNNTQIATTAFVKAAIAGGIPVSATTVREQQTATASQTLFNLTNSYTPGTNSLWVYINGVRQFPGTFTETNSTTVTFSSGLTAGDVVLFEIGIITGGSSIAAASVVYSPTSGVTQTDAQSAIAVLGRPITVVTATTQTAVNGGHYVCTNVAAVTVTLPATPNPGDTVWVTFTNGLATNVIARNGSTIMGLSEDMTVDNISGLTVELRYVNSSWRLV